MKKTLFLLMLIPLFASCAKLGGKSVGELRISFADALVNVTRSGQEIPDTSDFLLSITGADGTIIYEGKYGDSPESMTLDAGSYVVSAVSREFKKPAFSAPQYGDEQCVVVPDGGVVNVKLVCRQMNSGVSLSISKDFLTSYPSAALLLKSEEGSLTYSYTEKRIAYFRPGNVSLVMTQGAKDEVLMTRRLEAQEMLALTVSAASGSGSAQQTSGMSIVVDTSRYWLNESYVIGGSNGKGESEEASYTVSQARASVGEEDVWVSGYIVGGDLTSAAAKFEAPFTSKTNLLLGSRSSSTDRETCIAVQLPSGELRDQVNLVDNPSLLGKKVSFKGDIVEPYFGIVGLKNVTEVKIL